jgi:4'-phosphopantetheinyl transferase
MRMRSGAGMLSHRSERVRSLDSPTVRTVSLMHVPQPGAAACDARLERPDTAPPPVRVVVEATGVWRSRLAALDASLSAEDRARVARMRFERDRAALTIAYGLHREVLASVLGVPPHAVPLHRDALGRPRVAGDELWTSLSHAPDWVAIAVGQVPIGIDVEPCSRAAVMEEIAESVLHGAERSLVAGDREARSAALLGLWVRKEAVLKAAGVGLRVPMLSFAIGVDGAAQIPGIPGQWHVRRVDVDASVEVATATLFGGPDSCAVTRPSRSHDAVKVFASES